MTDTSGTGARAPQTTGERYRERLYVTWYWWPLPLIAAGLLAAEIHMGYPGVRAWLPYLVIVPLALLLIVKSGRTKVAVEDGELRVADAHLPLEFVGEVEVFGAKDKRRVLGPNLDPAAFMLHRGWVGPLVRVQVTDPADPTPYWVFSTRRPEELAAILRGNSTA
ncbi:Protein of unknown function [Actinokineospora alba]|uniref:DUF3093 domain-containing protein n=1 Tax=Actinokineospora alba TaxID=504798 RepID=A0A1H0IKC2_9PSEU|nr:DUF3093 domain-containing protein [Actinokineospora alba]TDP70906.1 hypothetical protein C8E96_6537 [Actinokineospora alba]SDI90397.1 Protein of unknown function [Actinokineospora alba]SDO31897.1 Protein of unknown function [Actinokineospora alba]